MADGWNCCIQGLNSATFPPHSKFIDLDLSSDLTHIIQTWSIFLSSSSPFPRMKPNPVDPPLQQPLPMISEASALNWKGRDILFKWMQKKNTEEQRCISWVSLWDSLTLTQLLSRHMYTGRKTWACFYESHLTSRLLVKQVSLHRLWFSHNTCTCILQL